MKSKKILFYLIFFLFFFTSFVSENKSAILPKKEISKIKTLTQKKGLKERITTKTLEKKINKIKKAQIKKQPQDLNSQKGSGEIILIFIAFLILLGLVGGILLLIGGKTLLGIIVLLISVIIIPLIIISLVDQPYGKN